MEGLKKVDKTCNICGNIIKYNKNKDICRSCSSKLWHQKKGHKKLTLTCQYCGKEFVVSFADRKRLYCSRSCQSKVIKRNDSRKTSRCIICGKEFKHYGERILCSRDCLSKYMSKSRIGMTNPNFKIIKKKQYKQKEYPKEFFNIREKILKRDNYKCQLCGGKQNIISHQIHHIDYNKKNTNPNNLITLCRECHNATHYGKFFWELIFTGLISGSKIVKKKWGAEIHIANNNDYCLKFLIFYKNKECSIHSHTIKKELWYCVYGKLNCKLDNDNFILNKGDKIEINPKQIHQLHALQNSIIIEVSTTDYPEDSIKFKKGNNKK